MRSSSSASNAFLYKVSKWRFRSLLRRFTSNVHASCTCPGIYGLLVVTLVNIFTSAIGASVLWGSALYELYLFIPGFAAA